MEVLLHFQQQPRAGTSHEENKASILNYHFGWKTQVPFHLKILPHSLEDFRSTIFHYVPDAPNMSDPSIYTEYEVYESKLKFIKKNIHDGDAFHALDDTCDDGRKCTFYISRGTYSIVAANSIDMSGCEHPYCEAYHYARMLETRFKKDVVGGVSLAVDHSGKKMWVWADCDEAAFEGAVLIPHKVEKKAAFQPYIAHLQHKPDGCKAVLVINRLDSRIQKEYLEQFFSKCGKIKRITTYPIKYGNAGEIYLQNCSCRQGHGTAGRIVQRFNDVPQILHGQRSEAQMIRS